MTGTTQGILSTGIGITLLWWLWRQPRIKVLATNASARTVSFEMKVNGKTFTDTFMLGDANVFMPVGDGINYFSVLGNATTKIVELSIGYFTADGGYKSRKSTLLSF